MPERRYNLNDKSLKKLKDTMRRVAAGKVSRRPTPTRRRPMGSGGGSVLKHAFVAGQVTAATGRAEGDWGVGSCQYVDQDGNDLGDPFDVANVLPTTFEVDTVVWLEVAYDPPRVVTGSCDTLS